MEVNKKRYLDYIKKFQAIKYTQICKELGVDRTNITKGLASTEVIKKVKEEIQRRLEELDELKQEGDKMKKYYEIVGKDQNEDWCTIADEIKTLKQEMVDYNLPSLSYLYWNPNIECSSFSFFCLKSNISIKMGANR